MSNQSEYRNWSIKKGDYISDGPSEQDMLRSQKISVLVKVILITLSVTVVVLGYVLYVKHFSH